MGFFDDCEPAYRFFVDDLERLARIPGLTDSGYIWDWDQRRLVVVGVAQKGKDKDFFIDAVARNIDAILPTTTRIEVNSKGELIRQFEHAILDGTRIPWYPPIDTYPKDTASIYRSELTEQKRMGLAVDLVTYPSRSNSKTTKKVAFKYYISHRNISTVWHEANCLMRIPPHPNIVPFDRLVLEKIGDDDRAVVVGFTTPYVPGGTIRENVGRLFKLKYLRQLIEVIDHLNSRLGIAHGDIVAYNLLIDSRTDQIQLFDWNFGSRIGWEGDTKYQGTFGYNKHRDDAKYTAFTLYEIITRDFHYREENYPHELDISWILDKAWIKHKDVRLDADVAAYRAILDPWVEKRFKTENAVHSKPSHPISWPNVPKSTYIAPKNDIEFDDYRTKFRLIKLGQAYIKWQRPPSRDLPLPGAQRLLATGQIKDDATGEITESEPEPTKLELDDEDYDEG